MNKNMPRINSMIQIWIELIQVSHWIKWIEMKWAFLHLSVIRRAYNTVCIIYTLYASNGGIIPGVSCRGSSYPSLTVSSDSAHLLSRCHRVQTQNTIFLWFTELLFFPFSLSAFSQAWQCSSVLTLFTGASVSVSGKITWWQNGGRLLTCSDTVMWL